MNTVFVPLAKGAFFDVIEGENSNNFSLDHLTYSTPHSFPEDNVIDL